ncbi:cysteine hydrolase [candidate division WOR-3 bacterium]|nr:cysteine hydrolase [candidate division WOR-3 bacterium]
MRHGFKLMKENAALLVIDMQRHFCDPASGFFVPGSDMLAQKLKPLVDAFCQHGRPVVFTRHIDSNEPDNLMLRWWSEQIREDDPMSEVVEILDACRGTTAIKHQYDGFLNTDLESVLRAKNVRQVVVCGVLTNLCCETTARSAFMRGFEVYFLEDGTATFTQEMHQAALLNLAYGFAVLTKTSDVAGLFTR